MSNHAYLVANDHAEPAGPVGGSINYDPDTDIVCASSWLVPALWLALFDLDDLTHIAIEEHRVPTLATRVTKAKERLRSRRAQLERVFAHNRAELDAMCELLDSIEADWVKLDATEIWDLAPGEFGPRLAAATQWFESGREDDFARLLEIATMEYDAATREVRCDDSPKHCLHGFEWVRDVPWEDD